MAHILGKQQLDHPHDNGKTSKKLFSIQLASRDLIFIQKATANSKALYFFTRYEVFSTSLFTRFPSVRPFLPLISPLTGFHDCRSVTRWAQQMVT